MRIMHRKNNDLWFQSLTALITADVRDQSDSLLWGFNHQEKPVSMATMGGGTDFGWGGGHRGQGQQRNFIFCTLQRDIHVLQVLL